MFSRFLLYSFIAINCWTARTNDGQDLFVEAECFDNPGGWKLDTQFINNMELPFLLAHGFGRPVENASTQVTFPETGECYVYVR